MRSHKSVVFGRMAPIILGGLTAWLSILCFADRAVAIPTFARKYRTSCITCHTVFPKLNDIGEAFRRNGYQFAEDDDLMIKEEPVPMGNTAYEDMFPDAIWPSDMPHLPPVFIRAQQRMIFHTNRPAAAKRWDMDFPHELVLGGGGSFGKDISAWWELEAEPSEGEIGVERAFVQFSNLFAWDEYEDEDGMHEANRWLALPHHAMNLRIGKLEPQVLPHVASQHARVGIQQALPIRQRIGGNRFRFEPNQVAVELHGILRQYNSYAVGFANGGNSEHLDENTHKDVYFRVARKWFGFPLDGVLEEAEQAEQEAPSEGEDGDIYTPGMDFWRAWAFETGFFGWWGRAEIPAETHEKVTTLDPFTLATVEDFAGRTDKFHRIGMDARLQWFDLDIYGLAYWGRDSFAGRVGGVDLGPENHFSWFVQADYMFKPWILGFFRYEQTEFESLARSAAEPATARAVPGIDLLIRQNLKLQSEWVIYDGRKNGDDQIRMQLDYTY